MQPVLLDSSIYIGALRSGDEAVVTLRRLAPEAPLWLSAVVLEELYAGANRRDRKVVERLEVGLIAANKYSADDDAGVKVPGEVGVEDGAAIEAAAGGFELVNDFHGADFGRAGQGAGGEASGERGGAVGVGAQPPAEARDQVHNVRVALDKHQALGPHAGEFRDS